MALESVTAGGALEPAAAANLTAGAGFSVSYDPWLVAASIAIAIMASFTGLRLASGLKDMDGGLRRRQIAKAALTLGGGIWSMHFVAMLAMELPVLVSYDALYTLGSVLLSILIVGVGLSLMHVGERNWARTIFAGTLTGLGIVAMHYVGMDAIGGGCIVDYRFGGAALSSAIAIGFSICAIRLAYGRRTLLQLCLGALVLGVTIAAMHYSAMAFTRFLPVPETWAIATPEIAQGHLALIVAVAAFLVCGLFLLTAMPLDGRRAGGRQGGIGQGGIGQGGIGQGGIGQGGGGQTGSSPAGDAVGGLMAMAAQPALAGGAAAASGAPLRAAFFDDVPIQARTASIPAVGPAIEGAGEGAGRPAAPEPAANAPEAHPAARVRLPYEQNNATLFIDAGRVQAVQADGHYSRLIDGAGRHFCPWSLSKVEAHLAGGPFIRTHRSFLVNLDHARGLRRERDKAFLMLPAMNDDPVPVSRSHLAEVRRALGL